MTKHVAKREHPHRIKPFKHQVRLIPKLVQSVKSHGIGIDTSVMGAGKTFTSLFTVRELGMVPLVVAPKSIIPEWVRAISAMGLDSLGVVNYEKLTRGSSPFGWWRTKAKKFFEFVMPQDKRMILIYDEAHKLKGERTLASRMAISAHRMGIPSIWLSATLAENPIDMKALGYCAGLFSDAKDHWKWCQMHGCWRPPWGGLQFVTKDVERQWHLKNIRVLLQDKMVQATREDIGTMPRHELVTKLVDTEAAEKIDDEYTRILEELYKEADSALEADNYHRQKVEHLKLPALIELIENTLAQNYSVIVFVNFRESVARLTEHFGQKCAHLVGSQTPAIRQRNIERFQSNAVPLIISTLGAGAASINLDDTTGTHPRVAFICPGFNARDFLQALGRHNRTTTKSPTQTQVVLASGTREEDIKQRLDLKIDNIETLTDHDLIP